MTVTLTNGTLTNGSLTTFSPLAFSPKLWLDSHDLTSLVIDGSRKVSQWNDKSGNGNNATQGIAARQPESVQNDLNNKNVIHFVSISDRYMLTSFNWPLAFTVFGVFRIDTFETRQRILSSYDGSGAVTNGQYIIWLTGSRVSFASFGTVVNSASFISLNTPYQFTWTCTGGSGGSMQLFVNQISRLTGVNNSTSEIEPIYIAEDSPPPGSSQEYFNGDIPEIIIYNSVLSDTQIANVENYLNNKWGI